MKKILALWSMGMTILIFASCAKTDLTDVSSTSEQSASVAGKRSSQPAVVTYGGQATGINATITTIQNGTVFSNQTLLSHTGLLPVTGGSLSAHHSLANIQNMVTAETLNASTSGEGNQTISQASATNLNVTVNGYVITADNLSSTATANCGSATGSSQLSNLVVNGTPVVITGAPNQTISFPTGGLIIINEQSTPKGKTKNITVTALHIIIPNAADVRVAVSQAQIKC